eukprot:429293-Prorocentrum_lima.AAC.1
MLFEDGEYYMDVDQHEHHIDYARPYKEHTEPKHPQVHKTTKDIIHEKRAHMQQQFDLDQQHPIQPMDTEQKQPKPEQKHETNHTPHVHPQHTQPIATPRED